MKVLVADDDSVNRRILETFLGKWGYEVLTAEDGSEAWAILQAEGAPHLVVLDWMMPGMDGAQICRGVRRRCDAYYTYIILLTAKFQKHDILEGLEAGADDYLTKPLDASELRARLDTGRRIISLQEELLQTRDRLQFQASHDALTEIWNHGAILEILQAELARCKREKLSAGILLLDIDHFKAVNDQHGHITGDTVLREVVRRLKARLRPYDSIGRYGGEEFLIVLPNSNEENAWKQAERLRLSVSESLIQIGGQNIRVTVSLGAAVIRPSDTADLDTLLRSADSSLYLAKEHGRNRVQAAWHTPATSCGTIPETGPYMQRTHPAQADQ